MRSVSRLAALLILLVGCQMQAPSGAEDAVAPLASEAISVTPLDAPPVTAQSPALSAGPAIAVQVPDKTTPRPVPRPATGPAAPTPAAETAAAPAAETVPEAAPVVVPPEQALCEKSGGQWAEMNGSTGHVCAHKLRDSGKSCRRKGDCLGECLARSHTCAPIAPLMGCNDILQADGTEVTLCLQ